MNAQEKDRALFSRIADAQCSTLDTAGAEPFTPKAARTLRRAQLTLHRWAELECGTYQGHIEREGDDGEGKPYFVPDWRGRGPGGMARHPVPDRERGALARVEKVCREAGLHWYYQRDPRGCALYVAAEPLTDQNYSSKGVPCL